MVFDNIKGTSPVIFQHLELTICGSSQHISTQVYEPRKVTSIHTKSSEKKFKYRYFHYGYI